MESTSKQIEEAFVLTGLKESNFRYKNIVKGSVKFISKKNRTSNNYINYSEGIDFIVDYEKGTVRRTPKSRIPDWSKHILYGKECFDHSLLVDYEKVY